MRFTGGDNLTGLEKKIHDVLMVTELNNGYGAYELSYAENSEGGNSGMSFGGNQMDMSKNMKNADIFISVLREARREGGEAIFTKDEVDGIKKLGVYRRAGVSPQTAFGELLPRVNEALASVRGREKINEEYRNTLRKYIAHVEYAISGVYDENRRKTLSTDDWKVRLVDYHNQFHIDKGGKMMKFLGGESVRFRRSDGAANSAKESCAPMGVAARKRRQAPQLTEQEYELIPASDLSIEEFKRFIRATYHYNKSPHAARALENRMGKVDAYI